MKCMCGSSSGYIYKKQHLCPSCYEQVIRIEGRDGVYNHPTLQQERTLAHKIRIRKAKHNKPWNYEP